MKHPKLRAFTVVEIIVALLLMTIVVAVAYAALSLTSKQLGSLQQRFGIDNEHRLLQHSLQGDFEVAQRVFLQDGFVVCDLPSRAIQYELLDSIVVRHLNNEHRDSFHFTIDSAFLGFESIEQQKEGGLIDELRLYLHARENGYPIYVHKIYDSVTLMEK